MTQIFSLPNYSRLQTSGRRDSGLSPMGSSEERRETMNQWLNLQDMTRIDRDYHMSEREDLLRIPERVRARLLDSAYLLDLKALCIEVHEEIRKDAESWDDMVDIDFWFLERIDRVITESLRHDVELERNKMPLMEPIQRRYQALTDGLLIPLKLGRRACIVFNRLPSLERHSFIHIILLGEPVEEYCPRMQVEREKVRVAIVDVFAAFTKMRKQWEAQQ